METISDKIAESGFEMHKEQFARLAGMSECGMVITKMQAEPQIIYANDGFYRMFQYTSEEFEECFDNKVMGPALPEEKQRMKALMARQVSMGGSIHLEFRAKRKDESIIWISFTAKREAEPGSMVYYCSCLDISGSKRHLQDVYNAKRELDLIANSIPGGVIKVRLNDFKILYANDGFFRLAGYSRSEYSMQFHNDTSKLVYPEDLDMVTSLIRQAIENRGPLAVEYRIMAKSGEIRWSYINGTRIDDDDGKPVYLCVIVDITARKQAEAELADNNHRSNVVTSMLKETIWTYDLENQVLRRDGDLGESYSPESILEGQFSDEKLGTIIHPDDVSKFMEMRNFWIEQEGRYQDVFRVINSHGAYHRMRISTCTEKRPGKGAVVYGLTRLLSDGEQTALKPQESKPAELEITQVAGKLKKLAASARAKTEDTITGLLPYASFLRKAEKILANRREDSHYALICADINEFQSFSHHYGFYVSNRILKAFSDVLLNHLTKDGMCARVDGDYFVVLFQYGSHKELVRAMSAVVRHQQEVEVEEDNIDFGSTVGVYLIQQEDHELLEMLEKADLARRSIKGLRGNHYAIYTEDMEQQLSREDEMAGEIRRAMDERTVEISYLPRIRGDKDHVIGCKAIPRILMKDGQYFEYTQIMHLMERGTHLGEFSFYLLQEVADNIGAWKAKGNTVIPVSLEMTASQLSTRHAVERIHNIVVERNNLEPEDFIFEIPERFFADATTAFEVAIRNLTNLGYRVIISRFGADHTAVNSMRRLPVTGIKFHGEYFSEHMINEKDTVVFQKTVEMAKEMGLTVTCGGIHTRLQEEYAKKIGCDVFEGVIYYGAMKNVVFEKCFLSE